MCNNQCQYIKNFINHFHNPLYVKFPESFEEYFKDCKTDARTCFRRATKNGFIIKKVNSIEPLQFFDIWTSSNIRQGRQINLFYEHIDLSKSLITSDKTPISDYSIFSCPNHNLEIYACFKGEKVVAYLELLNSNDVSIVHSTLGHADYLKYGIMKFLFLEVIRIKFNFMKYLIYGPKDSISQNSYAFKKDLLIIQSDKAIILQEKSIK